MSNTDYFPVKSYAESYMIGLGPMNKPVLTGPFGRWWNLKDRQTRWKVEWEPFIFFHQKYEYNIQKNITAYELSQLVIFKSECGTGKSFDEWYDKLSPKVKRHFKKL
jgi:hypothetical protein